MATARPGRHDLTTLGVFGIDRKPKQWFSAKAVDQARRQAADAAKSLLEANKIEDIVVRFQSP
jgi:hypothetical protein